MAGCTNCGKSTNDMSGTMSIGSGSALGDYLASRTWRCGNCGSPFCLKCAKDECDYKCPECGGKID